MSDIEELQGRIAGALDRIARGLDRQAERPAATGGEAAETPAAAQEEQTGPSAAPETAAGADPAEIARLRQALEDEQLAVEQWKERNARLKQQRDKFKAEIEAEQGRGAQSVGKLDTELQALRAANQQLRENNARLREANAAGLADAELVNAGLQAELEALRAAYAADRAETEAVMNKLSAAVTAAAPAQTQEDA
jgi:DNA repair exonuclease SbcCD ATPase subunit